MMGDLTTEIFQALVADAVGSSGKIGEHLLL
jgi:hypothetical protein